MGQKRRWVVGLSVCGLAVGMAGATYKMLQYRSQLHGITDNPSWERSLADSGAYDEGGVVLFGDSQIANWPMAESFGAMPFWNRGIVGDWANRAVERFERELSSCKARTVVILIGTNDLGNGQSVESILGSIETMTKRVAAKVILCSILPVRGEYVDNHPQPAIVEINDQLKALSARVGADFVDFFSLLADADGMIRQEFTVEGLHVNLQGYLRMTKLLLERL